GCGKPPSRRRRAISPDSSSGYSTLTALVLEMAATLTDEALNMFEALLGCALKKTERAHGGRVPFVRRVPVSLRRRGKVPRNSVESLTVRHGRTLASRLRLRIPRILQRRNVTTGTPDTESTSTPSPAADSHAQVLRSCRPVPRLSGRRQRSQR